MTESVHDALARLSDAECRDIAEAALATVFAERASMPDRWHAEHVRGIIAGAAPTFAHRLFDLLQLTGDIHARKPVRFRPSGFGA